MATWEKVMKNGYFDEIKHLYGKDFPWEVRSCLSSWLARDDSFMSFDWNDPSHHHCIFGFIDSLMAILRQQINATSSSSHQNANFYYKQRLSKLYRRLKAQDRLQLFHAIRDTLLSEKQRVDELERLGTSPRQGQSSSSKFEKSFAQIQEEIDVTFTSIEEKCSSLHRNVAEVHNKITTFQYNLYMFQQHQQNINGNRNNRLVNPNASQLAGAQDIQNEATGINQDLQFNFNMMEEIMEMLTKAHSQVLNELESWRDEQRLVALGKSADKKLESIEKWFKTMARCFEILELKLPDLKTMFESQNFQIQRINIIQQAIDQIETHQRAMRNASLVITQEPKQIVRTGPNIGPVRLLVLPFSTNMMVSLVKAVFINYKTAAEFCGRSNNVHEQLPAKSGDLKFGKGGLKVTNNRIEYQTITLSKVSKSVKRGEQFVVEERFWIYFRVIVNWKGSQLILHTTSLPISVTSHPVQEGKAWTHVLWYNAFPVKSRKNFEVPNDIPWSWLIEAINLRFLKLGKELSEEQKSYLKDRLFRGRDGMGPLQCINTDTVSKNSFCSDTFAVGKVDPETSEDGAPLKNYSFGEWLFCCIKILSWAPKNAKLAKYGLKHFWKDGKIVGFMSKERLEALLKGTRTGTFIIRFPENMPDYVGLYFYNYDVNASEKLLKQLLTIKDFNVKPLQDRVLDSEAATVLFPNEEKEKAFTRMCKTDTSVVDGYFTVVMKEDFPSSLLQSMSTLATPSPSCSHSVHSNYSRYNVHSPAESFKSDHSSGTDSCSNHHSNSEASSNIESLLDDYSVASLDGIDLRVLLDDNDIDMNI